MTDAPIHFLAHAGRLTLSAESRTITGTITVFDVPTNDYRRLILHQGALRPRLPLDKVKMLRDHNSSDPVGFMLSLSPDTSEASFKIAEGENGDRALWEASPEVKLRDGLSVGIQVLQEPGAYLYDPETGEYHVYAAELVEVSLCAIPAYSDAQVQSVVASYAAQPDPHALPTFAPPAQLTHQKEPHTMDPETLAAHLTAHDAEQERRLEARLATLEPASSLPSAQYASYGEFVKAYTAGIQEARDFALAYEGATTDSDYSRNTWLADAVRLVEKTRKVINSFTREPLPNKGMTLEYAVLKTNTVKVEKQAAQGDTLAFGKIELETKTTDVDTYGGYTTLTRQVIDRANSGYITTAFRAMLIEYARATEAAVRAVFNATTATQKAAGNKIVLGAGASAYDWLDLLVDAVDIYDDRGYDLSGAYVAKDVFKRLMRLEDSAGNSLMNVYGQGVNRTGEVNVKTASGVIANVEFKMLSGQTANTGAFYSPEALTVWEDSSPTRLEDGDVTNLTNNYSVYGYLAAASQFPDAFLPIDFVAP